MSNKAHKNCRPCKASYLKVSTHIGTCYFTQKGEVNFISYNIGYLKNPTSLEVGVKQESKPPSQVRKGVYPDGLGTKIINI